MTFIKPSQITFIIKQALFALQVVFIDFNGFSAEYNLAKIFLVKNSFFCCCKKTWEKTVKK